MGKLFGNKMCLYESYDIKNFEERVKKFYIFNLLIGNKN